MAPTPTTGYAAVDVGELETFVLRPDVARIDAVRKGRSAALPTTATTSARGMHSTRPPEAGTALCGTSSGQSMPARGNARQFRRSSSSRRRRPAVAWSSAASPYPAPARSAQQTTWSQSENRGQTARPELPRYLHHPRRPRHNARVAERDPRWHARNSCSGGMAEMIAPMLA